MNMLKDSFGRTFPYIRLSITGLYLLYGFMGDVCNFKVWLLFTLLMVIKSDKSDNRKFLHLEEIRRLRKSFFKIRCM